MKIVVEVERERMWKIRIEKEISGSLSATTQELFIKKARAMDKINSLIRVCEGALDEGDN